MSDVDRYRLLSGTHSVKDGREFRFYRKGDDLNLTPQQAKALGTRVKKLGAIVVQEPSIIVPDQETAEKILSPARTRGRPRKAG